VYFIYKLLHWQMTLQEGSPKTVHVSEKTYEFQGKRYKQKHKY